MRTDVELMLKAKAGSTVSFEWLVKRHSKALVRFFHWRLWDKALAEDFAQDVFVKLWLSLPNYEPRGPFKSYLFSIATNFLIDYFRRVKVRPTQVSLSAARLPGGNEDDGDLLDTLTAIEAPPEARLELEETRARLQQALADLPAEQYLCFAMHKLEGRKYEEIAAELGIPIGTVKSRMNAAFQLLRRAVWPNGEPLPASSPAPAANGDGESRRGSRRTKPGGSKRASRSTNPATRRTRRLPASDADDDATLAATRNARRESPDGMGGLDDDEPAAVSGHAADDANDDPAA